MAEKAKEKKWEWEKYRREDKPSQTFPELFSTLLFQLPEGLSQQEAPYLQTTVY